VQFLAKRLTAETVLTHGKNRWRRALVPERIEELNRPPLAGKK
jgi:hypothetical protein